MANGTDGHVPVIDYAVVNQAFWVIALKRAVLFSIVGSTEIVSVVCLYHAKQKAWISSDALVFATPFCLATVCNTLGILVTTDLLGKGWIFYLSVIIGAAVSSAIALLVAATISFNIWGS